jgi:hypothetical protein
MYDLDPDFALGLLFFLKKLLNVACVILEISLFKQKKHVLQQNMFFSNFHMIIINSGFTPKIL